MDLKEIKSIIDLMRKNSLSEFELEEKDFKIKLKRPIGGSSGPAVTPVDDPELTAYAPLSRQSGSPAPAAASSTANDPEIKAIVEKQGQFTSGMGAAEFSAYFNKEFGAWAKVASVLGVEKVDAQK